MGVAVSICSSRTLQMGLAQNKLRDSMSPGMTLWLTDVFNGILLTCMSMTQFHAKSSFLYYLDLFIAGNREEHHQTYHVATRKSGHPKKLMCYFCDECKHNATSHWSVCSLWSVKIIRFVCKQLCLSAKSTLNMEQVLVKSIVAIHLVF